VHARRKSTDALQCRKQNTVSNSQKLPKSLTVITAHCGQLTVISLTVIVEIINYNQCFWKQKGTGVHV